MTARKLNILIPTDFSDNALSALNYALKLYADQECTFYIMHSTYVTEPMERAYTTRYYDDKQNKIVGKSLDELIAQTEHANANSKHEFKALLSQEELRVAVKKEVEALQIDMVVMGTKGASGAVEYVMGSNTITVIKKIEKCPVLVLPKGYMFTPPKKIAFATDYTRNYEQKELKSLKAMVDLFQSKIEVVHVNSEEKLKESQEENKQVLMNYLAAYENEFHLISENSSKTKTIAAFVEEHHIDMLALVNYKHGILERFLNEPILKNLAFHPKTPMLVIPK